jgi:hypothetical protein
MLTERKREIKLLTNTKLLSEHKETLTCLFLHEENHKNLIIFWSYQLMQISTEQYNCD